MITLHTYFRISELRGLLRRSVDLRRLGDVVFMLPSRAAEDDLLDMLRVRGSYFGVRPTVWSWSELYRAFVPRGDLRRQIDPPDHRLVLRYILEGALSEFERDGVDVPKGVRRRGFVDVLSDAIRELLLEDVSPDRLLADVSGEMEEEVEGEGKISPRALLYRLYVDYLAYLDERGLADNSQLPALTRAAVAAHGVAGGGAVPSLCWVGFLSFTGAQLKCIRALDAAGVKMRFFVPDARLDGFRDAVEQLGVLPGEISAGRGRMVSLVARGQYEQFDAVAREIAGLAHGEGAFASACEDGGASNADALDVGVLVAPERVRLMASALRKYGVPCQSRAETEVADTALIELIRRAWELYRQGWPYRGTMHLLRNPLFGLSAFDAARMSEAMPEGAALWRKFLNEEGRAAFDHLRLFCEWLDVPEGETGHTGEEILRATWEFAHGEWERRLAALAGADIEMDLAVRIFSSACMEIEQKLDLLTEMTPSLGEAGDIAFGGADAVAFLTDWSHEARTALPPLQMGAATIYDKPPAVLTAHAYWVMTDVDSARYPGSTAEGALLDGETRDLVNDNDNDDACDSEQIVHLPTLHEKRQQKEALFRRLMAIGERATLVARSAYDAQGRPQGTSSFVSALLVDRVAGWHEAASVDVSTEFRAELSIEPGAGRQPYRGRFPRRAQFWAQGEARPRFAPSAIDEWLACPFSYWCSRVARIDSPRDSAGIFDPIRRGSVAHDLWRRVWAAYERTPGSSIEMVLKGGWAAFLESAAEKYPCVRDPRSRAALEDLRRSMAALAAVQDDTTARASAAGLARAGASTFEYELPPLSLANVTFDGRADRVDYWQGVGAVIVDYKLGSADGYRKSLQLAAYAVMMRAGGMDVAGFCYLGHADGSVRGVCTGGLGEIYGAKKGRNDPTLVEAMAAAEAAMRAIDAATPLGEYPANYDAKFCARCPYPAICRRSERYGTYMSEEETADDEE